MHINKKLSIILIICFTFLISYLFLIFILPKILNSKEGLNKFENFIEEQKDIDITINNSNFKITPQFKIIYKLDEFSIKKDEKDIFIIKNIHLDTGFKKYLINKLTVDYLYINVDEINQLISQNTAKKKSSFDLSKIPEIQINTLIIETQKKLNLKIVTRDLLIKQNKNLKKITFVTEIKHQKPINQIIIGKQGFLTIKNNKLFANNLQIIIDNFELNLNGKIIDKNKKSDLKITSNYIPTNSLFPIIVYVHKIFDPTKKFLENFYDYSGFFMLDINIDNNILSGEITAKNIRAKTVKFDVPVYFKEAVFTIKNNEMTSVAHGMAGTEKIIHKLDFKNIMSKDRIAYGEVESVITERLTDKYLPKFYKFKNKANLKITYNIQNQKINVEYFVDLLKNSDISYKNINLGLNNKFRHIYAHTFKHNDFMYLKEYKYSVIENNIDKNIISGEGFFIRKNNKFIPQYITCKTNNFAPTSVIGYFGNYVKGGEFLGEIKYDFNKNLITGKFELIKAIFNNFYIKSANITADETLVNVTANGTYKKESFKSTMKYKNDNLKNTKLHVYNLDLFLDKYTITKQQKPVKHKKEINISKEIRKVEMDIDNYNIKVNSIVLNRAVAKNICISGSLKQSVFNFIISNITFADGIINAKGLYNFNDDSSDITFNIKNINANIVGDTVFNLKNQIVGTANAKFHVKTYNKLKEIFAHVEFDIKDGYLPEIGNTYFYLNKSKNNKKFKLSSYTNVNLSRTENLKSNIKCSCDIENDLIKNINLTSQQEALALYIEGLYDYVKQNIDIKVFGKYNKNSTKKVKIYNIPLDIILYIIMNFENTKETYKNELNKIPCIKTDKKNERYFRAKLKGNLKNKKFDDKILKGIQ